MEDKHLQTIRYKLQKRVRRLNSATMKQFVPFLRQFFVYFNSSPILSGVRDDLLDKTKKYNVKQTIDKVIKREELYGSNEEEAAAMGHEILLRAIGTNQSHEILTCRRRVRVQHLKFNENPDDSEHNESLDIFRTDFLEPFYEYIDEHLDNQHVILYLLKKYKHRCEWFRSVQLRQKVSNDTAKGEKSLALDLYEYLHNAGIDFNIEPKSASGIPDFVTEQIGENRIVADTKIYQPKKSKGKSYLISSFNQIYTYLCDCNESFGYLVIYNMTEEDIRFLVPQTQSTFPSCTYNNKTIFFVTIDIYEYKSPASKRGQRKAINISENDLIAAL
jgi:hypothetical protein